MTRRIFPIDIKNMEQALTSLIPLLKDISWPAAFIVISWLVFKSPLTLAAAEWLKSKIPSNFINSKHEEKLEKIDTGVIQIQKNHLHEIKDLLIDIKETELRSERIMEKMNDNIIWVKSRINGKNN